MLPQLSPCVFGVVVARGVVCNRCALHAAAIAAACHGARVVVGVCAHRAIIGKRVRKALATEARGGQLALFRRRRASHIIGNAEVNANALCLLCACIKVCGRVAIRALCSRVQWLVRAHPVPAHAIHVARLCWRTLYTNAEVNASTHAIRARVKVCEFVTVVTLDVVEQNVLNAGTAITLRRCAFIAVCVSARGAVAALHVRAHAPIARRRDLALCKRTLCRVTVVDAHTRPRLRARVFIGCRVAITALRALGQQLVRAVAAEANALLPAGSWRRALCGVAEVCAHAHAVDALVKVCPQQPVITLVHRFKGEATQAHGRECGKERERESVCVCV